MKARFIAAVLGLIILCSAASAQGYYLRANSNINLRASFSLNANIVETAPAGTVLHVVGQFNRWLKVSRNGQEVWAADWLSYTHVESSEQAGAQQQTARVDNCCFVDRQCNTDDEWAAGYWAFQNNQCTAPAQTQLSPSSRPAIADSSQVDNCCHLGWQCTSDEDWSTGYYAFQTNQCKHWGIAIEGPEAFVIRVEAALDLLQNRAPNWYAYVISGLDKVKVNPAGSGHGVYVRGRTYGLPLSRLIREEWHGDSATIWFASALVHEACHVHLYEAGLPHSGLEGERACLQMQIESLQALNPGDQHLFGFPVLLQNIENREYQWWHD